MPGIENDESSQGSTAPGDDEEHEVDGHEVDVDDDVDEHGDPLGSKLGQRMTVTQMKFVEPADDEAAETWGTALKEIERKATRHGYLRLHWEEIEGPKHRMVRLTGYKPRG